MHAFVVLGLVFSVPSQEVGPGQRLRNDLFCVEWDVKPQLDQSINNVVCCVQVWNLTNCKLKTNHYGHTGYVNTVTVSPDGSLCASGGKVSDHVILGLDRC